jgi:hypothetical protein
MSCSNAARLSGRACSTAAVDPASSRSIKGQEGRTMRAKTTSVALWAAQGTLAALFLFAGGMKLVLPIEAMAGPIAFPGWFLRFIGLAEVLGALGLVLPAALRIRPMLTPIAAAGLVVIMVGATATTAAAMPLSMAVLPFVTGVVAAWVGYGRLQLSPIAPRDARQRADLRAALPANERVA